MSEKQKLTPLFPPEITPVRDGVYLHEYEDDDEKMYSLWRCGTWHHNSRNIEYASLATKKSFFAYQSCFRGWRGVVGSTK